MLPQYILLKSNLGLDALVIAVSGYVIVFVALVLLFWFFSMVPRLLSLRRNRSGKSTGKGRTGTSADGEITGESTAAIAMALHLYLEEIHDRESGVLTIKRISKAYSPWSSKIYAVRNQFNRL